MEKKKATPKSDPKHSQCNGNSLNDQRQRVLIALRQAGSNGLSTIQLREDLDVMMPGARIFELRHNHGLNIQLIWNRERNAQGNEHNCGRYILFPGMWRETA
ncbi:MAG: helix-turn-helix domain-containing protein [Halioglobus sp.]|nr:helix-turn-helix domain-containing protein [Halioglobus sp.]